MVYFQVVPKGGDVEYAGGFFSSCPERICSGGHRTPHKPVSMGFHWKGGDLLHCTPKVTAAIPAVIQGTGRRAPALRAKPAEAYNQAFWYGLVQSCPVESRHRWTPVIHVHQ